jgi:hypothetical protein
VVTLERGQVSSEPHADPPLSDGAEGACADETLAGAPGRAAEVKTLPNRCGISTLRPQTLTWSRHSPVETWVCDKARNLDFSPGPVATPFPWPRWRALLPD